MNKKNFTQWYTGLIFFVMFIYGINNQAIGTLITNIIEHYGIRMAQAGLLSSFTSVGNFAALFVVTIFTGRINKIILMGGSLFFFAVSLFILSYAPPFSIVLISFAFIGVFGATTDTLTNSLIADLMPDNISRNLSLLHGLYGLGGLCGPIIIDRFVGSFSWAQVYFAVSMVYIVYLTVYALFAKWQWSLLTIRISNERQTRIIFSDIANFFANKQHVLLWVAMFFYAGNQATLAVWIKRYVDTHLNVPLWGAYALSAMWLGTAICRLLISPNIKASSSLKICAGNFISAVAIIAGLLNGSAPGITVASLAVGLSSGLTIPLVMAIGCEWYPEKTTLGTVMPFTAFYISAVIFPPLSGFISDSMGIPWGVGVGAVSAFLTAVFSGMLYAGEMSGTKNP